MLQKGIYRYEYVHDRKKFIETSPPGKEVFYNHLNMKDITDVDCVHAKRNCKDFEIKFFPEYHDLDVQSDTLFVSWCISGLWKYVS